jgi:hypothetical protein
MLWQTAIKQTVIISYQTTYQQRLKNLGFWLMLMELFCVPRIVAILQTQVHLTAPPAAETKAGVDNLVLQTTNNKASPNIVM